MAPQWAATAGIWSGPGRVNELVPLKRLTWDFGFTSKSHPKDETVYIVKIKLVSLYATVSQYNSRVYFRAQSPVNDLLKPEMTDSFNLKSVSDL